jgi:hypothetical protein
MLGPKFFLGPQIVVVLGCGPTCPASGPTLFYILRSWMINVNINSLMLIPIPLIFIKVLLLCCHPKMKLKMYTSHLKSSSKHFSVFTFAQKIMILDNHDTCRIFMIAYNCLVHWSFGCQRVETLFESIHNRLLCNLGDFTSTLTHTSWKMSHCKIHCDTIQARNSTIRNICIVPSILCSSTIYQCCWLKWVKSGLISYLTKGLNLRLHKINLLSLNYIIHIFIL